MNALTLIACGGCATLAGLMVVGLLIETWVKARRYPSK